MTLLTSAVGSVSRPLSPSPVRRVCLVTESAGAGVGRHFLDLAAGLARRGIEVVAIYSPGRCDASFRERQAKITSVRFVELPMRRAVHPLDAVDLVRLVKCIRSEGPFDVVHCHSSKAGALGRLAARWLRVPSVYTPHALVTLDPTLSPLKRRFYGGVERWLARKAAALIAVSPDEAEHAAALGIDPQKLCVVLNGIEPPEFPTRDAVREELGLSADTFCVGFVGRLTSQKAPELLMEALADLKKRQIEATAVIVGSGPEDARLREQVARLGLAGQVRLLGDRVATNVMPAFDVFCLPSRYEGLPYVLVEALAAGLPIVARRVGGAAACVDHGANGFIVEREGSDELANALASLQANAAMRNAFARHSLNKVRSFGLDRMIEETCAIYERATSAQFDR